MAAIVRVDVYHGAGPSSAAWTANELFHRADTSATSTSNPVPVPNAGTANSWPKWTKMNVTTAPAGSITNLRWFDGSSWGTGIKLYAKKNATYTQGSSTDETKSLASYTDAASYTSGSPYVINSGTVLTATTGVGTQDYLETIIELGTTAVQGTVTGHTLTYRFDET